MKLGWFRFCFNKDILEDHYLIAGQTNVSKTSPVFNLYSKLNLKQGYISFNTFISAPTQSTKL